MLIACVGVLKSSQARTTPIAFPYEAVVESKTPGATTRILHDTSRCIQRCIEDLVKKDPRYDAWFRYYNVLTIFRCMPVFVLQHFGRKDPIRSVEDIRALSAQLHALFDLSKVFYHRRMNKATYMQDIGLDIL